MKNFSFNNDTSIVKDSWFCKESSQNFSKFMEDFLDLNTNSLRFIRSVQKRNIMLRTDKEKFKNSMKTLLNYMEIFKRLLSSKYDSKILSEIHGFKFPIIETDDKHLQEFLKTLPKNRKYITYKELIRFYEFSYEKDYMREDVRDQELKIHYEDIDFLEEEYKTKYEFKFPRKSEREGKTMEEYFTDKFFAKKLEDRNNGGEIPQVFFHVPDDYESDGGDDAVDNGQGNQYVVAGVANNAGHFYGDPYHGDHYYSDYEEEDFYYEYYPDDPEYSEQEELESYISYQFNKYEMDNEGHVLRMYYSERNYVLLNYLSYLYSDNCLHFKYIECIGERLCIVSALFATIFNSMRNPIVNQIIHNEGFSKFRQTIAKRLYDLRKHPSTAPISHLWLGIDRYHEVLGIMPHLLYNINIPEEHYLMRSTTYFNDVIKGHPMASHGWMSEALDELIDLGMVI